VKGRPILFSAPMVRAILEGRKTQTRRIVKPRHILNAGEPGDPETLTRLAREYGSPIKSDEYGVSFDCDGLRGVVSVPMRCPYGERGDRLWVKETWQPIWAEHRERRPDYTSRDGWDIGYVATDGIREYHDDEYGLTTRCKPSIFMPRVLSRISLEITAVRVERLHAMTRDDAIAEGARRFDGIPTSKLFSDSPHQNRWSMESPEDCGQCLGSPLSAFGDLWIKLNGQESWDANPWVWVVEFKAVQP